MNRFNEFWNINAIGSESSTQAYYNVTLLKKDSVGQPITEDFLIEKYQDYVNSLKQFQNGKFTKKEYRISNPLEWLSEEKYLLQIIKTVDPLDFYLYGL